MTTFARLLLYMAAGFVPYVASTGESDAANNDLNMAAAVDFVREVRPIITKHCYSCHGPEKQESGLRLDQRADALAGGDRGSAIEPGDSAGSRLIQYVTGENDDEIVMPPENERLSAAQIKILRRWIDEGAKWPEE